MARTEPGWDLYRTFLAVTREGSLSAAARRLELTQPTVGRQIEALEALLGNGLFTRSPRGLVPTPAAREIISHAQAMAAAADALHRASSGEARGEAGTVRVTASEIVGHEVLPPILAAFGWRYPRIELELVLSNRNEDLLRRDADIAVRMARPTQQALVARRIGSVRLGLFAHRRYAEAFGLPETPEQLAQHRWIGFDRDSTGFRSVGTVRLRREQFGFRCDSGPAQLAALRAGVGIAGCHVNIARREPDLLRVLERPFSFTLDMWLAMHRDAKATRRIRLLFDHLAAGLASYVGARRSVNSI
jgi:DNA-binding transcriptional LysR family regulator